MIVNTYNRISCLSDPNNHVASEKYKDVQRCKDYGNGKRQSSYKRIKLAQ